MAWLPVSNTPIQYMDANGDPYSGAVLKFYAAGTSTNIPVATAQTGTPTVTSVALNSDGFPEVSGNTVVLFIDQDFKVALYPTQAAADSNTGAIWNPDNIDPFAVLTLPTNLTDINALTPADGAVIVGDGTEWVAESGNTARTSLGVGSADSPTFANVTLTGLTTGRIVIANSAGALTAINTTVKGTIPVGNGTTTTTLAAGTNTHVLTANSGATNGVEWAAAPNTMVFISQVDASVAAAVDFEGLDSTYAKYVITAEDVRISGGADILSWRVKIGGSWISTTTYRHHQMLPVSGSAAYAGDASAGINAVPVCTIAASGDGGVASFTAEIHSPAVTGRVKIINTWGGAISASGVHQTTFSSGSNSGTDPVTGIRFLLASHSITGTFRLYGIKNS